MQYLVPSNFLSQYATAISSEFPSLLRSEGARYLLDRAGCGGNVRSNVAAGVSAAALEPAISEAGVRTVSDRSSRSRGVCSCDARCSDGMSRVWNCAARGRILQAAFRSIDGLVVSGGHKGLRSSLLQGRGVLSLPLNSVLLVHDSQGFSWAGAAHIVLRERSPRCLD
jgi:hypothetical protein